MWSWSTVLGVPNRDVCRHVFSRCLSRLVIKRARGGRGELCDRTAVASAIWETQARDRTTEMFPAVASEAVGRMVVLHIGGGGSLWRGKSSFRPAGRRSLHGMSATTSTYVWSPFLSRVSFLVHAACHQKTGRLLLRKIGSKSLLCVKSCPDLRIGEHSA
jgi:hypothetical protein